MQRLVMRMLLVLSAVCLPLTCLPVAALFNPCNPMALMFKTSFRVDNALSDSIYITPIGTIGEEGHRTTLPILRESRLYIHSPQRTRLPIAPGDTRTIFYDWDDVNFSEILVHGPDWSKMLVVDPEPTENQYHASRQTHFVIGADTELVTPTPAVLSVREPRRTVYYAVLIVGCCAPVVFIATYRRLRWLRDSEAPPQPTHSHVA